jgi:hypothetical protein
MALACTKDELVNLNPDLHSLSPTQLQWLLVLGWAERAGFTLPDDLTEIIEGAVCLRCLSPKEMLVAETAIVLEDGESGSTGDELMEKVKCLACTDPDLISAGILWLKCQTLEP